MAPGGGALRCTHHSSSWRQRSLRETLALAEALLPGLGIVRVLDATRLDRLGLPVWMSVRPRGLVLSVHAGKGLHEDEARVGAMMEAIEHAAAEPQRSRQMHFEARSPAELQAHWAGRFDLADLAPPLNLRPRTTDVWDCVRVESLGCGGDVWMPAELVFLPWRAAPGRPRFFGPTGNGLASGNSVPEASLHALFELLERDVAAMHEMADETCWVDPAGMPEPFASLARAWASAGVNLIVRELPNEFGLPCFAAVLHEPRDNHVDMAGGWGLHARSEIALSRAICEAAQSRASMIHGGRDDIGGFFGKYRLPPAELAVRTARQLDRLYSRASTVRFADVTQPAWADTANIEAAWDELLQVLAARGLGQVFRHVFDVELQGLSVVRVIVPGLEHAERPLRRMGPRLLRRAVGDV